MKQTEDFDTKSFPLDRLDSDDAAGQNSSGDGNEASESSSSLWRSIVADLLEHFGETRTAVPAPALGDHIAFTFAPLKALFSAPRGFLHGLFRACRCDLTAYCCGSSVVAVRDRLSGLHPEWTEEVGGNPLDSAPRQL